MDILRIIIAILLPPAGVAMQVGITTQFWINIVLTLFGYIPGIIHALWIILSRDGSPKAV
ncbi:YqaE/Pmp3 family membrane protein [Marinicaulis aureus]|uniref:YqaE/Pmp3 family membrane protein n=1 Tax=Hyphococcus aureus TaxID=2666033 RepID=A0ABW1KUH9_9PROT